MHPVVTLLVILIATSLISVAGSVVAALLVRATIEDVRLFYGGTIFKTTIKGVPVLLGWLPTGGSVGVKGLGAESPGEEDGVPELSAGSRVAVHLGASLALLLAGCVCAGAGRAIHGFLTGLYQIPLGALHPVSLGSRYLQWALDVLHSQGLIVALGIVWTKLAALNILPFSRAGSHVLLALAGSRVSNGIRERIVVFIVLMEMLIFLAWGVALFAFFLNRH